MGPVQNLMKYLAGVQSIHLLSGDQGCYGILCWHFVMSRASGDGCDHCPKGLRGDPTYKVAQCQGDFSGADVQPRPQVEPSTGTTLCSRRGVERGCRSRR